LGANIAAFYQAIPERKRQSERIDSGGIREEDYTVALRRPSEVLSYTFVMFMLSLVY
jgi:hypothetical protein